MNSLEVKISSTVRDERFMLSHHAKFSGLNNREVRTYVIVCAL